MQIVTGTKILQHVVRDNVKIPDQKKGEHLWCCGAVWECKRPELATQDLDMESLINIDGPGCWWCEERYTKEIAAKPCLAKPDSLPF